MGRHAVPLFGRIRRGIFADKSILIGHTRSSVAHGIVFRAAACARGYGGGKKGNEANAKIVLPNK